MRFQFSKFELDTDRLELRADGEVRALEPQVFDVLRHLVENAERLVSRDELIDVVWGGRAVSDATVSARINAVRRALGDSGQRQALIKTVPRRGFRFVGEVTNDSERAKQASQNTDLVASNTTRSAINKPSIAVLPFTNMSGDPEQEYFSDGMTEDIITALSRLRWLFVISRNSTFTYKGRAVDVKQVGHDMGVRYVLEGSVRKAGKRIRVTAQLADAETGSQIWAERYDRELADMFDLQDELTASICAQVHIEVAGSERDQAHRQAPAGLDVWELYQRGMWHYYKYSKDNMLEARKLLRLAAERDPEFAGAFAGLAVAGFSSAMLGYTSEGIAMLEESLDHAERAIALDNRDGFGFYAMGRICTILGDRERAIPALRKSVDLNPSSAVNLFGLGYALWWFGMAEEGLPLFTRAIRLSPRDPQLWMFHYMRSLCHAAQRDYALAVDEAKTAIQVKRDEFWPYLALVMVYDALGRSEEAKAAYTQGYELNPLLCASYLNALLATLHAPYWDTWRDALYRAGLSGN